MAVRVTVLVENTARVSRVLGEHGLAYWIEIGGHRVLFDAGQGKTIGPNAQALGVDLSTAGAVVLSHGHYDHTGGLSLLPPAAPRARLFAHPAAFEPKFVRGKEGGIREIGMPPSSLSAVEASGAETTWTTEPTEIAPGLWATGPVPRVTDFEDAGGAFYVDAVCRTPDPFEDDQALYFDSGEGTVVLLGCAHAGVVNVLRYVRHLTGGRPIHAVLGGMHLLNASSERLARTVEGLGELGAPRLGPMHCTGTEAVAALWSAFPGRCLPCGAGSRVEFDGGAGTASRTRPPGEV